MTTTDNERYRTLKRTHQRLLRDWKCKKSPCIICGEREGITADHLPPAVLFPASIRPEKIELFTFPVCLQCNKTSSDEDFLFSVLLSLRLNQESILNNREPIDPDLLALYQQTHGHLQDSKERSRRARLLQPFLGKDPHTGLDAIDVGRLPVNQTLTKIVKSIYWLHAGGDILQRYNPGWWVRTGVETSKERFIENHLKTSHADLLWGDRFIAHFTIGLPENEVGGFISCSLHFYTKRAVGTGMSWLVMASPAKTLIDGRSLYEWSKAVWGPATIEANNENSANQRVQATR